MPKLDLTTALQIKGASGEIFQLKGQGFSWEKPGVIVSSLVDGLTLTRTHTRGSLGPPPVAERSESCTWCARNVVFPITAVNGVLYEMGGDTGFGIWMASDGTINFSGVWLTALTNLSYPVDSFLGQTLDVTWCIDNSLSRIRLWLNNTLILTGTLSTQGQWTGANGGGFGETSGNIQSGVTQEQWPVGGLDILEVYVGQAPA